MVVSDGDAPLVFGPVSDDRHVFTRATGRPLAIRAEGRTITDADGRTYLDGAGGAIACSIGHGRPEVAAAMATQASAVDYVHATQFSAHTVNEFAARVAALVPIDDARVFPVSGGSEANETALKLARSYHLAQGDTERHVILARAGSYHGNSRGALDASDRDALRAGYEPWLGQTARVPLVNPYRDDRPGTEHADEIDRMICSIGPQRVAAFLAEPVSGATLGAVVPPDDYWPAVAAVCESHGVLLILDEVMTGFGRTGTWFAADHWGVRPDIITAGKGVSSGYWPMGLCIASGKIFDAVQAAGTFVHGFTWSHHPIGSAAAGAVLTILERDGLVESAGPLGERCRNRLRSQLGDHANVGDIRGIGLLNAVELVRDRASKQPFDRSERVIERITAAAFERGLTIYPCASAVDGHIGDAALLGPPLNVTEPELDEMVDRLAAAVGDVLPA